MRIIKGGRAYGRGTNPAGGVRYWVLAETPAEEAACQAQVGARLALVAPRYCWPREFLELPRNAPVFWVDARLVWRAGGVPIDGGSNLAVEALGLDPD